MPRHNDWAHTHKRRTMLRLKSGNIFSTPHKTITITANCVGVMETGIEKQARTKSPEMFSRYQKLCKEGRIQVGIPYLIRSLSDYDKDILLFPTRHDWREPTKTAWIEEGLLRLQEGIKNSKLQGLALAPVGCAHEGLHFIPVLNLILLHLQELDCQIDIYTPRGYTV